MISESARGKELVAGERANHIDDLLAHLGQADLADGRLESLRLQSGDQRIERRGPKVELKTEARGNSLEDVNLPADDFSLFVAEVIRR